MCIDGVPKVFQTSSLKQELPIITNISSYSSKKVQNKISIEISATNNAETHHSNSEIRRGILILLISACVFALNCNCCSCGSALHCFWWYRHVALQCQIHELTIIVGVNNTKRKKIASFVTSPCCCSCNFCDLHMNALGCCCLSTALQVRPLIRCSVHWFACSVELADGLSALRVYYYCVSHANLICTCKNIAYLYFRYCCYLIFFVY